MNLLFFIIIINILILSCCSATEDETPLASPKDELYFKPVRRIPSLNELEADKLFMAKYQEEKKQPIDKVLQKLNELDAVISIEDLEKLRRYIHSHGQHFSMIWSHDFNNFHRMSTHKKKLTLVWDRDTNVTLSFEEFPVKQRYTPYGSFLKELLAEFLFKNEKK